MSEISSPYAKWVVKGWAAHSKSIGGPAIAEAFRRNLTQAGTAAGDTAGTHVVSNTAPKPGASRVRSKPVPAGHADAAD